MAPALCLMRLTLGSVLWKLPSVHSILASAAVWRFYRAAVLTSASTVKQAGLQDRSQASSLLSTEVGGKNSLQGPSQDFPICPKAKATTT